jgi:feruloyl esterase
MIDLAVLALASSLFTATPCEALKSIALPDTTITFAEMVPAGPSTTPAPAGAPPAAAPARGQAPAAAAPGGGRGGRGGAPAASPIVLPAHCRVAAILKPSPDSAIEMEVWLPAENWNGKFQAVGNGGWAGVISYAALASALQEGYATASTDTGHKGGDASFALGHVSRTGMAARRVAGRR